MDGRVVTFARAYLITGNNFRRIVVAEDRHDATDSAWSGVAFLYERDDIAHDRPASYVARGGKVFNLIQGVECASSAKIEPCGMPAWASGGGRERSEPQRQAGVRHGGEPFDSATPDVSVATVPTGDPVLDEPAPLVDGEIPVPEDMGDPPPPCKCGHSMDEHTTENDDRDVTYCAQPECDCKQYEPKEPAAEPQQTELPLGGGA